MPRFLRFLFRKAQVEFADLRTFSDSRAAMNGLLNNLFRMLLLILSSLCTNVDLRVAAGRAHDTSLRPLWRARPQVLGKSAPRRFPIISTSIKVARGCSAALRWVHELSEVAIAPIVVKCGCHTDRAIHRLSGKVRKAAFCVCNLESLKQEVNPWV